MGSVIMNDFKASRLIYFWFGMIGCGPLSFGGLGGEG